MTIQSVPTIRAGFLWPSSAFFHVNPGFTLLPVDAVTRLVVSAPEGESFDSWGLFAYSSEYVPTEEGPVSLIVGLHLIDFGASRTRDEAFAAIMDLCVTLTEGIDAWRGKVHR